MANNNSIIKEEIPEGPLKWTIFLITVFLSTPLLFIWCLFWGFIFIFDFILSNRQTFRKKIIDILN